jgi:hypothetical protein
MKGDEIGYISLFCLFVFVFAVWQPWYHWFLRQILLEWLTCLSAELSRSVTQSFKTNETNAKWREGYQAFLLLLERSQCFSEKAISSLPFPFQYWGAPARQALCHLSHTSSPFCFMTFQIGSRIWEGPEWASIGLHLHPWEKWGRGILLNIPLDD